MANTIPCAPSAEHDKANRGERQPSAISGIGGWLLLPALGLILAPFLTAISICLALGLFNYDGVARGLPLGLTTDLKSVLTMEVVLLSGMVLFQVYVAMAFFECKTTAPKLVIALFIARVVYNVIDLLAVVSVTNQRPEIRDLLGSLMAAGIWVPYFLVSKRVKATFIFGEAIGNAVTPPPPPQCPETVHNSILLDPSKEICTKADERLTALPVATAIPGNGAEWFVIRAGKELGPFSLAELIEKAGVGEIEADDLVKQTGGLWTKAREFGFLQQQFLLRDSREKASREAINKLGRFQGIWLSKKVLAIAGCVFLALAGVAVVWAISKVPALPSPTFTTVGTVKKGDERKEDCFQAQQRLEATTVNEKVAWFKRNLHFVMTHEELLNRCDKAPFFDLPDKCDTISHHQANREFNPIDPISADRICCIDRYYPYETVNGPAYRVNLLWAISSNGKGTVLWAHYVRAPN